MSNDEAPFALASAVLLVRPECISAVSSAIDALPGAVIHVTDPKGKLLITLEAPESGQLVQRFDEIKYLDGVLSADLIYQHAEETSAPYSKETVP